MSQKRQRAFRDPAGDGSARLTALARDYPPGFALRSHFHERDQLVYASRGVMTVRTRSGTWVVPTHRAVWIPATVPHSIVMSGAVAMRTLYLRPVLARSLPRACCVINVSPLLRELILQVCQFGALKSANPVHRHLREVIVDQLATVQAVPLQLPNPSDPRALRLAEKLLANPGDRRPLVDLYKRAGASQRTLERLFLDDTGLTFGKWRQQLRLMHAMRLLAEGAKVTHAALDAGYSTPSAFISMFRKALGTTPTRYFGPANQRRRSDHSKATDR